MGLVQMKKKQMQKKQMQETSAKETNAFGSAFSKFNHSSKLGGGQW